MGSMLPYIAYMDAMGNGINHYVIDDDPWVGHYGKKWKPKLT